MLFCSGKLYYELLAKQKGDNRTDIAVVRVEQLYPFPESQITAIMKKYSKATAYWVQEEPQNNGVWFHIATFHSDLGLKFIGRPASASPASGFVKIHNKEQQLIINKAFE